MIHNNNIYVILNWSEIIDENSTIDFSQLLNTNAGSLRKNNDSTKAIVKYNGSQPSFLNGKTTYSHSEILTEINITNSLEWHSE